MTKCQQCEEFAETKWQWPDDNNGLPRQLVLCGSCGAERWNWLQQNATGTRMYLDVILSDAN
jgi:hypothetical protein